MPFDAPFKTLSGSEIEALRNARSQKALRAYLDGLARLHDLLCESTHEPQHAVTRYLYEESPDRQREIMDELATHAAEPDHSIGNTLFVNFETAAELERRYRSHYVERVEGARELATNFVDALLGEYQRLRGSTDRARPKLRAAPTPAWR